MARGDSLSLNAPVKDTNHFQKLTEKMRFSFIKRFGQSKHSRPASKHRTSDSSSTSSEVRMGAYLPLRPSATTPSSPLSLPVSANGPRPRCKHTRHASLIPGEIAVSPSRAAPVFPRKAISAPSMQDVAVQHPSLRLGSPAVLSGRQRRKSLRNGADDPRTCPSCRGSCSASNSAAGPAAVPNQKPSDRRSQHKFHKLFNLEADEPLVKSFPCALVGDILFQGTFYASEHFFCFHSKFAKKRKLIQIAIREVTNVTREKTAGIIPNAIALNTKNSRFVFASIIGRENIFRLLTSLWETQLSVSNTLKWVSNDGVIHDSSVDTELDTEEDEEGVDEVTLTANCVDRPAATQNGNRLTSPDTSPSTVTAVGAPSSRASSPSNASSVCRRRKEHGDAADVNSSHSSVVSFTVGQCLRDLWSLPRVQLCLFAAYIILIFLAFSAIVLAWRVHAYQAFLHERIDQLDHSHSIFEPYCRSDNAECNLYRLRQQTHKSRIKHVQAIMKSNIRTLNDLARRLRVPETSGQQTAFVSAHSASAAADSTRTDDDHKSRSLRPES